MLVIVGMSAVEIGYTVEHFDCATDEKFSSVASRSFVSSGSPSLLLGLAELSVNIRFRIRSVHLGMQLFATIPNNSRLH